MNYLETIPLTAMLTKAGLAAGTTTTFELDDLVAILRFTSVSVMHVALL